MLRGYIDAYLADIAAAPTRRLTIIVILSKIQYTDIDTLSSNPTSRSRSKPLDVYACSRWSMVDGRWSVDGDGDGRHAGSRQTYTWHDDHKFWREIIAPHTLHVAVM